MLRLTKAKERILEYLSVRKLRMERQSELAKPSRDQIRREVLRKLNLCQEEDVMKALASAYGVPFARIRNSTPSGSGAPSGASV